MEVPQHVAPDGRRPEQRERQERRDRDQHEATRSDTPAGDLCRDCLVHPGRGSDTQRSAEGQGVGAHAGRPRGAHRAAREMGRELGRLDTGQLEVESAGGQLEGTLVDRAGGRLDAHDPPSAASRTRRSWARERHMSVRVAASVRPIDAAIS